MTIYKFAGFWRRFVAYMIDGFIISVIFFVLAVVAGVAYFAGAMTGDPGDLVTKLTDPEQLSMLTVLVWAFSILLNIIYFTYFHGSSGRTPGKMLLGLQVVTTEGQPISFGIAFLRSVGYLVSSFVFCLGYLWVGFDKRKQGWHDKIAGTVVIIRDPDGKAPGISIPDAPDGPSGEPSSEQPEGVDLSQQKQVQPDASVEENEKPNNQKIP